MSERRELLIRCAKVYLREARSRPHQSGFRATLHEWAARCRRELAALPKQRDMFA